MEELDIIIPAYNAKNTLDRLLYSIAIQKNVKNYKVYIVNDCSDYDYADKINHFKDYFWIKELKLEKNMGPGYARQYGIDSSTGKYIMFADSDDFLYSPNALYELTSQLANNYEVIISNFISQYCGQELVLKKNYTWLHGKIYNRDFLYKNSIRFNNTRENEDNGFNYLVRFHKPRTLFLDKVTYVYYENMNSITRKNNRIYDYTGLESFAYNLEWAITTALNKNIQSYDIIITVVRAIITMYFSYLYFFEKYNCKEICFWTKGLKLIFNKYYNKYINEFMIKKELEKTNNEYISRNIKINFKISFWEFLKLVEEM